MQENEHVGKQFPLIYRGIVKDNSGEKGRCKVFIPGVYPEEFENDPRALPWAEPAMPLNGGNFSNRSSEDLNDETGFTGWPKVGANVWVFFFNGAIRFPVYFAACQAGDGWQSEHNQQWVFKSDNVRVRIDENPSDGRSTSKFNTYNEQGTYLSAQMAKTEVPTTVDIEVKGKVNLVVTGAVNLKVVGDLYEHIEGDIHRTHIGNLYDRHVGDKHIVHEGGSLEEKTGDTIEKQTGDFQRSQVGNVSEVVVGHRNLVTTETLNELVGDSRIETFGDLQTKVLGDRGESVTGNVITQSNGDVSVSSGKNVNIMGGEQASVKAPTINLN